MPIVNVILEKPDVVLRFIVGYFYNLNEYFVQMFITTQCFMKIRSFNIYKSTLVWPAMWHWGTRPLSSNNNFFMSHRGCRKFITADFLSGSIFSSALKTSEMGNDRMMFYHAY